MKIKPREQVKKMKEEGKTITEISKELKISKALVFYYFDEDYNIRSRRRSIDNFKKKTKEEKSVGYKKRLPYQRKYQFRRYKTDKDYRESRKRSSREHYRRKVEAKNEGLI